MPSAVKENNADKVGLIVRKLTDEYTRVGESVWYLPDEESRRNARSHLLLIKAQLDQLGVERRWVLRAV